MLQSQASKIGECEVCDLKDIKITVHYGNMWFCDECWDKEQKSEHMSEENQQKRVDAYRESMESRVLQASRAIDNTIQVKPDLFNAATKSILELKHAIDENPEVTNKPYALAEELTVRFNHYKQVVFDAQQAIVDAGNNQKAIQVYLNQLANSLRAEEREKLKIADINYKPSAPKSPKIKAVTTSGTKKKATKLDIKELRKFAVELNVSEFTIQGIIVAKGCTLEQAVARIRKSQLED